MQPNRGHWGWSLLVLVACVSAGCGREQKQKDVARHTAEAEQKAAVDRALALAGEQEAAKGKQALGRWAARMKAIRAALPATAELKTTCEALQAPAPLETVDSPLLDSIEKSPSGAVDTGAASGFATLQSSLVRTLFYELYAVRAANWKKVAETGNQLDAATQLAVFALTEIEQPSLVAQDSFTGGGMKGALVVFDLGNNSAVCRIPLKADTPTKSKITAGGGKLDGTGSDLQQQVLDWMALELRKKAEAQLAKLAPGVKLAEPLRP